MLALRALPYFEEVSQVVEIIIVQIATAFVAGLAIWLFQSLAKRNR